MLLEKQVLITEGFNDSLLSIDFYGDNLRWRELLFIVYKENNWHEVFGNEGVVGGGFEESFFVAPIADAGKSAEDQQYRLLLYQRALQRVVQSAEYFQPGIMVRVQRCFSFT